VGTPKKLLLDLWEAYLAHHPGLEAVVVGLEVEDMLGEEALQVEDIEVIDLVSVAGLILAVVFKVMDTGLALLLKMHLPVLAGVAADTAEVLVGMEEEEDDTVICLMATVTALTATTNVKEVAIGIATGKVGTAEMTILGSALTMVMTMTLEASAATDLRYSFYVKNSKTRCLP
jgi:hypothetical protein